LERSDNPGIKHHKILQTLKGFAAQLTLSGIIRICIMYPGLSLRSNPGLKLANAFGVCGSIQRFDAIILTLSQSIQNTLPEEDP